MRLNLGPDGRIPMSNMKNSHKPRFLTEILKRETRHTTYQHKIIK